VLILKHSNIDGMNISNNKYDSIERIIFDEGLKIKSVKIDHAKDRMIIQSNKKAKFIVSFSLYKGFKNATPTVLNHYQLIANNTGIHWPDLDEDISLKGVLNDYLRQRIKSAEEITIA